MRAEEFDIADALDCEERLPRPRWDLLAERIMALADPAAREAASRAVDRQWVGRLGAALGGAYRAAESDRFLVLAPDGDTADALLWFAGRCRDRLEEILPGVAEFPPGWVVALCFGSPGEYYQYLAPFYPEGVHGGSAGMHIRLGRPHVALHGREPWALEFTLAHELTHVALHHLDTPPWLEEGLAQVVEQDLTGRPPVHLDGRRAAEHKRCWGRLGLGPFWSGEVFGRAGRVQQLGYELAEILARLLLEDARPGWFRTSRAARDRLLGFVRGARAADAGEAPMREHLAHSLGDLAARFLGPGDWTPRPAPGPAAAAVIA
jgi:hypothetical protein